MVIYKKEKFFSDLAALSYFAPNVVYERSIFNNNTAGRDEHDRKRAERASRQISC